MKLLIAITGALMLTLCPLAEAQRIPLPEISVYIDPQIKLFYLTWWSAGEEWNYDVEVITQEFNSPSWWRPMATLNAPQGHWFLAYTYYDVDPLGIARVAVSHNKVKKTEPIVAKRKAKRVGIWVFPWITIVRY
tara:strand:+ start:504 stop:905 length:402 start_codon:yes stop_codon:yes gene_type:complete